VPAYEVFNGTELLGRMAMDRMLAGVSTRGGPVELKPVGSEVTAESTSTSKSAVSRKFVAKTETAPADLLAEDLSGLDLVALMIDGVHFADHLCVVALGIDIDGTQHTLALVAGSTENATLVRGLLVGLRERGLDGAKALAAAVKKVFDHPVIARCQLNKLRTSETTCPRRCADPSRNGCEPATTPTLRARSPSAAGSAGQGAGQAPNPAPPVASVRAWPRR